MEASELIEMECEMERLKASDLDPEQKMLAMLDVTLKVVKMFEDAVDKWSNAVTEAHEKGFEAGFNRATDLFTTGGTTSPNRWGRDERDPDSSDYLYVMG